MCNYCFFVRLCVGGREMIIYIGCNNIEVIGDIDYSIKDISKYLSKNNIELIVDNESLKCGYTLINAGNLKNIKSALTDVDLHEEINRFYGTTSYQWCSTQVSGGRWQGWCT